MAAKEEQEPILKEEDSEPCSEYGFCVREKLLSDPPRAISWWSFFQYFAQMVCTCTCMYAAISVLSDHVCSKQSMSNECWSQYHKL